MSLPVIDRGFVRIAEGQVHLRRLDTAAAEAPPLLLLHASPSSSRFMTGLMMELADGRRTVIAPDTLGNGDSPPPSLAEPDIAYFADSVLRLADAMGLSTFDVYGSHTGARIACELAAAAPNRVRGAIFDGIREYDAQTREAILANYAPAREPDAHGTHMVWAFHFVRDQSLYFPHFERDPAHRLPGYMPPPRVLHDAAIDVLKAIETYAKPYLAAFRYPTLERMPLISVPVLLLRAEQELASLNAAIAEMAALVPHSTVVDVASEPAAKARAILAFLDGIDARPATALSSTPERP